MAEHHDVIVVLGAALLPGGRVSRALRRRVEHAAGLFHDGRAEHLLVTGGGAGAPVTEAEVMRAVAVDCAVPAERIVVEDRAANTFENAVYSTRIMVRRGWRHALVVSDPFHLPRALFLFRRMGATVAGDGVRTAPGEPAWRWYGAYAREGLAFVKSVLLFLARHHKRIARSAAGR
jgi:uncharacterized SAM-binding protein YcdF (DUF218 family)